MTSVGSHSISERKKEGKKEKIWLDPIQWLRPGELQQEELGEIATRISFINIKISGPLKWSYSSPLYLLLQIQFSCKNLKNFMNTIVSNKVLPFYFNNIYVSENCLVTSLKTLVFLVNRCDPRYCVSPQKKHRFSVCISLQFTVILFSFNTS